MRARHGTFKAIGHHDPHRHPDFRFGKHDQPATGRRDVRRQRFAGRRPHDDQSDQSGPDQDVHMEGRQLFFQPSASLWVKYDAGITTVEASGKIAMDIHTTYSVKPDWSIATQTQITDHRWLQKPVLKVVGVNLPVGLLADLVLQNTKRRITRAIDQAVSRISGWGLLSGKPGTRFFSRRWFLQSTGPGCWLILRP